MRSKTILSGLLILILLTGCNMPGAKPAPTSTPIVLPTPTILPPTPTTAPTATATLPAPFVTFVAPPAGMTQVPPATFCADSQVTAAIDSLKTALQTSNGATLATLVSPTHGMDVRYFRNGRVVNYDSAHAKFLFDSTFQVNWGDGPASGLPKVGAFHEVVLPALLAVFNTSYTLTCNQVQVGGTTYQAVWPYTGVNFYSVYYGGTQANGNLDWHTWLVGFEYINGRPYINALMQFEWEP